MRPQREIEIAAFLFTLVAVTAKLVWSKRKS